MNHFIHSSGKVIAVDFDGTIVEHKYPKIGKEMPRAFHTIRALQQKGHRLVLWTYRQGKSLEDAVDYCKDHGVEFYAVNENYHGETRGNGYSRKLNADIFIDDRNIGGFLGWNKIWQCLHPEEVTTVTQKKHKRVKIIDVLRSIFSTD